MRDEDAKRLKKARSKANKRVVPVGEFTRTYLELSPPDRRLANWEEAEAAVLRLCSHFDRHGYIAGDEERARILIGLLEDTFCA